MEVHNYRKLKIWQKSMDLVENVYSVTKSFPQDERYGLVSQMRRCAIAIPSNIAEGSLRRTKKDFLHFLHISFSSGAELETQLEIAKRLQYVTESTYKEIHVILQEVMKMLNVFMRSSKEEA